MSASNIYAVVQNGIVVNIVLWDGVAEWEPPAGTDAVLVPDGKSVGIGDTYAEGTFTAPPLPPVPPPSAGEILATNTATRNQLLAAATMAIAPLQDADDLGEATAAETALLKAWKQFRVAVNRVDLTGASPSWPSPPQPGYGAALAPSTADA